MNTMNTEANEFLKCAKEERGNFISKVNAQEWNTNLRCAAESLIIIFDQMIERLENECEDKPVLDTESKCNKHIVMPMLLEIAEYLDCAIELANQPEEFDEISNIVERMHGIVEDNHVFIRN